MDPSQDVLRVASTTWNRDSHELFDYESRHVAYRQFLLKRAARVFRNILDVLVVADGEELPTNADYLLSIRAREGRFYVYPADRSACSGGQNLQPRKLWLITKHLQSTTYPLSEGDVIKLGRFKLRVKQLVAETSLAAPVDFKLDDVEVPASNLSPEESQNLQCRICLLEGGNDEDPLVRACQCKGSIMYIHLACLQHWVNGRLNLNEDPQRSCCFVRQLQCELCKSPFPSSVVNRGVRFNVVKVPNVQPPFIVLENLVGPTNRGVHLCSMAIKKECKLGRGHESDVRIADVSISRFHAMIKYQDGNFLLQDHTSKFGTLVALRRPTMIEKANNLAVQVGRTVLQFSIDDDVHASWLASDVVDVTDKSSAGNPPAYGEEGGPWGPEADAQRRSTPDVSSGAPPAMPTPEGQQQMAAPPLNIAGASSSAGPISPVEDVLRAFYPAGSGTDLFDPAGILNLAGSRAAQGTPLFSQSTACVRGRQTSLDGGDCNRMDDQQQQQAPYFIFSRPQPPSQSPSEHQADTCPAQVPLAASPPTMGPGESMMITGSAVGGVPVVTGNDPQEAFASMLHAANLLPSSQQQQRHLLLSALAVQFDLLQRQVAQPMAQQPPTQQQQPPQQPPIEEDESF